MGENLEISSSPRLLRALLPCHILTQANDLKFKWVATHTHTHTQAFICTFTLVLFALWFNVASYLCFWNALPTSLCTDAWWMMFVFWLLGAVGQAKHVTLTYMPFKTDIINMLYSLQIQSNIIIHLNLCYWLPDDIPSQFISIWNGIFRIMFTFLYNHLKLITVVFPLP